LAHFLLRKYSLETVILVAYCFLKEKMGQISFGIGTFSILKMLNITFETINGFPTRQSGPISPPGNGFLATLFQSGKWLANGFSGRRVRRFHY
jgi:hypothetical protein